ncbi:unnamed protein product [Closterium sp. NIES-64]|nr:unnamed protein product [Closterium sp. NIES-64]
MLFSSFFIVFPHSLQSLSDFRIAAFFVRFSYRCILHSFIFSPTCAQAVGERACWDDARPAFTGVWLPPTRPADHALGGKPLRQRCDEASFSHVCWLLPLRPWGEAEERDGETDGLAEAITRRGAVEWRVSAMQRRGPEGLVRAFTWRARGQRGEAAVEAFSAKSPPSFLQGFTGAARRGSSGGRGGTAVEALSAKSPPSFLQGFTGGSAVGQQWRRSLLNPRFPSFRASRGQRGGAAVEAFSAKSPPSFLQGFTGAARRGSSGGRGGAAVEAFSAKSPPSFLQGFTGGSAAGQQWRRSLLNPRLPSFRASRGAAGQQWRRSLLNPRLPSFRASRGQRGGAAVEAFSAKSPPSFLQGFTGRGGAAVEAFSAKSPHSFLQGFTGAARRGSSGGRGGAAVEAFSAKSPPSFLQGFTGGSAGRGGSAGGIKRRLFAITPPPFPSAWQVARPHGGRHGRSVSGSGAAGRVTRTECQWKWGGRPGDTDGGPTQRVPTSTWCVVWV